VVGEGSTHGDLDTLESIHHQQSKRTVENVEVEYVVERGLFPHLVLCTAPLERDRVGRESVVANVADIPRGAVSIRDLKSAICETVDKLFDAKRWLLVR
tara:strand:- start:2028 stop:2324 length:297 start_codon:yes stop_codon:yes gene_type:complete